MRPMSSSRCWLSSSSVRCCVEPSGWRSGWPYEPAGAGLRKVTGWRRLPHAPGRASRMPGGASRNSGTVRRRRAPRRRGRIGHGRSRACRSRCIVCSRRRDRAHCRYRRRAIRARARWRAGIDRLIIVDQGKQALFLPAVWNETADPRQFLTQLKLKAGIATDRVGVADEAATNL
jgi:hypothetical protein